MSITSDVHSFFGLMDAVFCKLDVRFRTVIYAYYKDNLIGKNMTFEEFFLKMGSELGIVVKDETINNVYDFTLDKTTSDHVFFAPNINGERKTVSVVKTTLEDGSIGLYFDNLEKKMGLLNLIDPLTGTYQKQAFINNITRKINEDGKPYTLMILDIDNFKGVNDNYGHLVGDRILKEVAKVLRKNIKNGAVGRYGGDEFVCVSYSALEYQDIWNLLYKITHEMYDVGSLFEKTIDVSVTVGVSRYGIDGKEFNELFVKADRALYRGKRKGKNCFIIYDDKKHRNINIEGVRKTIIDERESSLTATQVLTNAFNIMNGNGVYSENLKQLVEYITTLFKSGRVVIYTEDENRMEIPLVFNYAEGSSSIDSSPFQAELWGEHYKSGLIVFNKVSALVEVNPELHAKLSREGIASAMRSELIFNNTILGSIEIDSFEEREWMTDERYALSNLGNLISLYLYKINENLYLEHKNVTDPLTNTLTYARFVNLVQRNLDSVPGKKVMGYINLSNFKHINDKFGFKNGDVVLKKMASAIKRSFKTSDFITRISGDRFLFYKEDTEKEELASQFDKFITELNSTIPDPAMKEYIIATCGIYYSDGIENSPTVMIDNANIARKIIGDSKESKLNFYSVEDNKKVELEKTLERVFPQSLNKGEFEIYFQPKFDMKQSKLIGAEALSRWNYQKSKILSPLDYIPLLEKTHQIEALDLYVFERVCKFIKSVLASKIEPVPISVNVSRNVENISDYIDELEYIREKYGIDPKYLEIEITETMFGSNSKHIIEGIEKLHNLGYVVTMDDFGSGYSNLASLAECRFDVIKIDKSLCSDGNDQKKYIVLEAVIEMAKKLGSQVICEGVETKDQEKHLLDLGCGNGQGYLYDKPITISDFSVKYIKK